MYAGLTGIYARAFLTIPRSGDSVPDLSSSLPNGMLRDGERERRKSTMHLRDPRANCAQCRHSTRRNRFVRKCQSVLRNERPERTWSVGRHPVYQDYDAKEKKKKRTDMERVRKSWVRDRRKEGQRKREKERASARGGGRRAEEYKVKERGERKAGYRDTG